jgi:hypothetical protein
MRWCAILKVHTLPDPIPTAIVALVLGVPDLTTTLAASPSQPLRRLPDTIT